MVESLQELIVRGRFLMADAPERLKVFESVNGRRNTEEIAKILKRHISNTRRDLTRLLDVGLIRPKIEKDVPVRKNGYPVYEKVPLARTVPLRYFSTPTKLATTVESSQAANKTMPTGIKARKPAPLAFPTEQDILDIAKTGEDQIYEFKGQGTEVRKITREIAAMLNTSQGGMIFYGIDDSGTIEGSDISLQKLDQPLQNSVRNSISPSASVKMRNTEVMGTSVIVIIVPPWNKKDVYQYDERVLIRRGTNVFAAKPDELRSLHSGRYVI